MISVIIPAHNEQKNVNVTITQIYKALKHLKIKNFEIIFIDDCSTDKTYIYAKLIANKKKYNLKVYKNLKNLGWGGAVKRGIKLSKQKYIVWIPGDNGFYYKQYIKIISNLKGYEFVSSYFINAKERVFYRYLFTSFYTPLLNLILGRNFPYYNGLTFYNAKKLKKINIIFNSHIFQVEIWIKLITGGLLSKVKFVELRHKEKTQISTAFRFKNATKVTFSFFYLIIYYTLLSFLNLFKNIK